MYMACTMPGTTVGAPTGSYTGITGFLSHARVGAPVPYRTVMSTAGYRYKL